MNNHAATIGRREIEDPDIISQAIKASTDQAVAAIAAAHSIVLACHVNPDGDALGSMLGLAHAIDTAFPGKDLTLISHDGVPDIYEFLPGAGAVVSDTARRGFDLAIALDSGDLSRVGDSIVPAITSAHVQIDIDHHVGEGAFGDIQLLDDHAAASAEIVFDLVHALGVSLTPAIASCLFTGVITDTGSFRFMNVTPRTLRIAATLIEAGAAPAMIAEQVFDNRPFAATRLMGIALSSLSSTPDGRVVWAHVTKGAFDQTGAEDRDTEGFVGLVRAVRGVQVAILFREAVDGSVRVSLRSTEHVDVAKIANQFGGGGHRMAAGCTFVGPLVEAEHAIVAASVQVLPAVSATA